jgi:hypothetical protein
MYGGIATGEPLQAGQKEVAEVLVEGIEDEK